MTDLTSSLPVNPTSAMNPTNAMNPMAPCGDPPLECPKAGMMIATMVLAWHWQDVGLEIKPHVLSLLIQ